jgi:hypothetical protein
MSPVNWVRWPISEDALEYAGIAQYFVEGRGFVNPVMLSFTLDDAVPPLPGFATRAPVLPLLLAIPISLGASLHALGILHQAWAALIVGALVLVARRSMSLAAAVACAATFAWSTGWLVVSQVLVTEVSAVGALLLVIVTARGASRSLPGALVAAGVAVLAWLTRPNLGLVVPAVWLAGASTLGPRAALRSRPLWLYALASAAAYAGIVVAHRAATGVAPYAQYDVLTRSLSFHDFAAYETLAPGTLEFVRGHWAGVRSAWAEQLRGLATVLFTPGFFPPVGWLAVPALAHALRSPRPGAFEQRVAALAGVVLLLPLLVLYAPSDPRRYPIPSVVALWIAELGLLDDLRRVLGERMRGRGWPWATLLSPTALLALALAWVAAGSLPRIVGDHAAILRQHRMQGSLPSVNPWDPVARDFCPLVFPGAVVAAGPSPWAFYFWCGNPSMWTPNDLTSLESLDRFLAEHRPDYVVASQAQSRSLLRHSPRLRLVARRRGWILYRVDAAPGERDRRPAPLPLHRLGG